MTDNGATAAGRGAKRWRSWRVPLFAAGLLAIFGYGVLSFHDFASGIIHLKRREDVSAEAVVAFTGGQSRVDDALRLLIEGKAKRLLISGVNPHVDAKEIARAFPASTPFIDCCIDLDYRALNTRGNARESGRWAVRNGFRSLIVVTSDYHMPRTLLELADEVPHVRLEAYPVFTQNLRRDDWWRHPGVLRLLLSEYSKYILAVIGLRLDGSAPA